MIRLLNKVPSKITIALSGGPDSMAALHFFSKSKRDVRAVYFNHLTSHGYDAEVFVTDYCKVNDIPLTIGRMSEPRSSTHSPEEHWRISRYKFFKEAVLDSTIITAHHLDDAIEWWVFSSLHGRGKLIPPKNSKTNVIRPFLLNKKEAIMEYISTNKIPYITDPSNSKTSFTRNYIRHELMPHALRVNPGLPKTIKKKYLNEQEPTTREMDECFHQINYG